MEKKGEQEGEEFWETYTIGDIPAEHHPGFLLSL